MTDHLPSTVPELLRARVQQCPDDRRWFRRVAPGEWQGITWGELGAQVEAVAGGLRRAGLMPGERIAVFAPTSPEWAVAELAALAAGAVVVGVDPHASPEQAAYVLEHSGATWLVVDRRDRLERLRSHAPAGGDSRSTPPKAAIKKILLFDPAGPLQAENELAWESLAAGPAETDESPLPAVAADAPAAVIYTSGTTGPPKAITYAHRHLLAACRAIGRTYPEIGPDDAVLCWLPMAHLLQRVMNLVAIDHGSGVYFVDDPREVVACCSEVDPSVFVGVPRFYERLYDGIRERLGRQPAWRRGLAEWAVRVGIARAACRREGRPVGPALRLRHWLADRLVLRRIRGVLGRRMKLMVTGSAPAPPWLLEFFHGIGLLVLEAYGVSENTVPMAGNRRGDYRFGSVGKPLEENEIRLADDGEVLVRGPGVFAGYDGDDAAERFTPDGFYRTGDLGRFDAEGFLYLTGRKSEIIKTSTGRRLSPAAIEAAYTQSPYLDQVVVFGDARKYLVGLLVLGPDAIKKAGATAMEQDRAGSRVLVGAEVERLVAPELETFGAALAPHERIVRFAVLAEPLSIARGELTPTLKVRRRSVAARHARLLDDLYREEPQGEWTAGLRGSFGP